MHEDCRLGYQEILHYATSLTLASLPKARRGKEQQVGLNVNPRHWHSGIAWLQRAQTNLLVRLDYRLLVEEVEVYEERQRIGMACPIERAPWQLAVMERSLKGTGSIWELDETQKSDDFYHISKRREEEERKK